MPLGHSAHLAPSARVERLAVRVDRAYSSLPTCSPAPSVIADTQWYYQTQLTSHPRNHACDTASFPNRQLMIPIYLGIDICCLCGYACHVVSVSGKKIPVVRDCGRAG